MPRDAYTIMPATSSARSETWRTTCHVSGQRTPASSLHRRGVGSPLTVAPMLRPRRATCVRRRLLPVIRAKVGEHWIARPRLMLCVWKQRCCTSTPTSSGIDSRTAPAMSRLAPTTRRVVVRCASRRHHNPGYEWRAPNAYAKRGHQANWCRSAASRPMGSPPGGGRDACEHARGVLDREADQWSAEQSPKVTGGCVSVSASWSESLGRGACSPSRRKRGPAR
jgi:hypothetical protein